MENIAVAATSTPVQVDQPNLTGSLALQNQSDTDIFIAVGSANLAQLTAELGLKIAAGDTLILERPSAALAISAIHGGSGTKTLHRQVI